MTRRNLLIGLGSLPLAGAKAREKVTQRSVRLPFHLGGRAFPVFQNNVLAFLEADQATLVAADAGGRPVTSRQLEAPEAAITFAHAVAVSPDRSFAIAAGAKDRDGRLASVLIFADSQGNVTRLVRTSGFSAGRLLFLPDGRLLCVGREHDARWEEIPGHAVLRFYSPEGVLLAKAVRVDLLRPAARDPHPLTWRVAAGPRHFGLLDTEEGVYAEVDHEGKVIRPPGRLGIPPGARVTGLALLPDGGRLVSAEERGSFPVWRVSGPNGQLDVKPVTGIERPDGAGALHVLAVQDSEAVFLAGGTWDTLVFAPVAAL